MEVMLPKSVFPLLLFVGLVGRASEGAFKFTTIPPKEQNVAERGNATLHWVYSVDNRETELKSIVWLVNEAFGALTPLIVENTSGVRAVNPAISPAFKGRVYIEDPASLVILNVTQQDSLSFTCELRPLSGSGLPPVLNTVKVIVKVPPRAVVDPQVIAAKEGDSASFTCTATGDPSPIISWYRSKTPGVEIANSSDYEVITNNSVSKLTIKNVAVEDPGYFVCSASSAGFEPGLARSFFGVLSSLSSPKGQGVFRTAKVYMQELVVIECPVSGFPPLEVTWTLPNGSVLPSSLDNALSVNPTNDKDFGNYTCSAESLDKTIGPFITSIQKRVSSLKSNVGTPAVVTWNLVSNATFYTVEVTGDEVEDDG